jgi:predicted alpha/beta hydrolase
MGIRSGSLSTDELTIPARDDYSLAARIVQPAGSPRASIVISPGVAMAKTFYERYADHLAECGYAVLTYDYRGMGGSKPESLQNFEASLTDWGRLDMNGIFDWLDDYDTTGNLVVVGHSAGCQLLGLTDRTDRWDAGIFVTPPHGYWGHWPSWHKIWMVAVMYGVIPTATKVAGYFPGERLGLSQDMPNGVALEWARWCRSPDYLFDHFPESSLTGYDNFNSDCLALQFTDDLYAPERSVDAILSHYPQAKFQRRRISPEQVESSIGHFGFFRDRFKNNLWKETVDWLEERL